jgi:hypothetical protein
MATKTVSKDAYVWAHVGTIIFHLLLAIAVIAVAAKGNVFGLKQKTVLYVIGGILFVVSALSLVPILKDYERIIIE